MKQLQEQRIDVHARRIPVEMGTRRSHYSPREREVLVDVMSSAEKRIADEYKVFCECVELEADPSIRRFVTSLLDLLPQQLQASCKVIEHHDRFPTLSLIIHPAHARECLHMFELMAQTGSFNRQADVILETITDQIRISLDDKETHGPKDQKLQHLKHSIDNTGWDQFEQLFYDPEAFRVRQLRNVRVHELTHLATIESRWHGFLSVMYELKGVLSELESQSLDGEQKYRVTRLLRAHDLMRALLESDAYIHQSMGTLVVPGQHSYDHYNICNRLIELSRLYYVFEGQNEMAVDLTLKGEKVIKDHKGQYLEHPAGTMVLLLAPDLQPEDLTKEFLLVESDGSNVEGTRLQLLERALPLVKDSQYAEQYLISVYDKVQTLLQHVSETFNHEFQSFCKDYPDAVRAVDPLFIYDLDQYYSFMKQYPDPFDQQGLRIHPIERRGTGEQKQTMMGRLLGLARRSFTRN
jgi:hypothetical protein